ncbi:hypothetical protein FXF51_06340 [Nonomuraea sp. PA05]|uniref:hypothetical protein n=1 Tax=Nonomuraea sp. PA05 TaxID=2604466 RepID=UPI0011DC39BF|nr:hypothetical protein [Nonomuraea sp. PA05]TYB69780.1 hypothetical protein FXF51_06340 [Nonomuraea sp. PA05]
MYTVVLAPDAERTRDDLPPEAMIAYMELQTMLEMSPENGPLLPGRSPTANFRTHPFGATGIATYFIDERQDIVFIVSLQWL